MSWKPKRIDLLPYLKPRYSWLLVLLLAVGCATSPKPVEIEDQAKLFKFPYQYQSLGAGNAGVMLPIIPFNKDAEVFSLALRTSLQDLEYSIIKPDAIEGPSLPQKTQIQTDAVDLARPVVENHNQKFTQKPMPLNAIYRLSYELMYGINKDSKDAPKHFWLNVRSRLERRAAAGDWHQYARPYSGSYFAQLLKEAVSKTLDSVASQNQ